MIKTVSTDPIGKLLKALNSFPEINKGFKTLYGVSKRLLDKYPNSVIFEFISILSYNKGEELLEQLNKIYLGDFYKDVANFKYKAFQFFIDCIEIKRHLENEYVAQKVLELIGQINADSFILKYTKMIEPLIKDKPIIYQTKIKLLVMIPNNFNKLHLEMLKEFPSFPDSIIDFYSYSKIKNNTDTFLKIANEKNNIINSDDNIESCDNIENLRKELLSLKTIVKNNNTNLQKELKIVKDDNKTLFEKYDKLREQLYMINFRDSIKSFLDELMEALNLFNYNLSISMKIEEIKTKMKNLCSGLNDTDKKCAIILVKILDHLKSLNKSGDDFSHYFNNIGFSVENLSEKVKKKYLVYTNGNENCNNASLVVSSLNGLIPEAEEEVMNSFLKQIISRPKNKNSQENTKEIIESIKTYSNLLVA